MSRQRLSFTLLTLAVLAAAGSDRATAQTNATPASIEERLNALEQEIKVLKQEQQLQKEQAATAAKTAPIVVAGPNGFSFKTADGNFAVGLHGLLQGDARYYLEDHAKLGTDTFLLRRARPILEATVFHDFNLRLMPDFGNGSSVIQDAYLEWVHWPAAQLRIGKFKEPVGLEQLQSDSDAWFTERALPSGMAPNRDVGAQLAGTLWGGVLTYAVGVFNGVPDGGNADLDNNDPKDFAGRLFVQPFQRTKLAPLQGLGLGMAGTFGDEDGTPGSPNLPSYKTSGQNTFFKYLTGSTSATAAVANGNRDRLAPQAYYYWGPVGLLGEYTISEQEITLNNTTDTMRNQAWQIAGSIVLTGENASYRGVTPKHPFDLNKGQWGAFELVGRYNEFRADPDAFPTFADPSKSAAKAHAWGLGVNWWLNRNLKFMVDYEQTNFAGGAGTASAVKDRPQEETVFTRAQFNF